MSLSISHELQGRVSATTNSKLVFSIRLAWNSLQGRQWRMFRRLQQVLAHPPCNPPMWRETPPRAVSAVLQDVVRVGGVGEEELALNGHTAALLGLEPLHQHVIWSAQQRQQSLSSPTHRPLHSGVRRLDQQRGFHQNKRQQKPTCWLIDCLFVETGCVPHLHRCRDTVVLKTLC